MKTTNPHNMKTTNPYNCQIAARSCPASCGNAECAPAPTCPDCNGTGWYKIRIPFQKAPGNTQWERCETCDNADRNAECAPAPVAVPPPGDFAALRADVRGKVADTFSFSSVLAAEWFRVLELLDHADAQAAELTQARQQLVAQDAVMEEIRAAAKVPLLTPGQARAIRTNTGGGGSAMAWSCGQTHGRAELAQELFSLISL
jgi:hypothetical protein